MSNTKVVRTGTQKFVWNDFIMPILTSNGTIDNTNYTYACAFKGSGGTTAGSVYNAFDTLNTYFGFKATDTDTRVLVFYTPYKLKVSNVSVTASTNATVTNHARFNYYYRQTTLPASLDDITTGFRVRFNFGGLTDRKTLRQDVSGSWSNYHCFSFVSSNNNGSYDQMRIHRITLHGKYQDGYQPTSGTADFTKPAYSVVKDGSIYKAIL